jgi:DNA ligase-associated metallophosphoesterase
VQNSPARQPNIASGSACSLVLCDETLTLLPQRAVWWEQRRTLFVSDLHLGKEATFRAAGMPVPDQTEQLLRRLSWLVDEYSPTRLVVLGDLIHSRRGRCETTFELMTTWRRLYREVTVELIRGNHDRSAGDPPPDWQFVCHADPHLCKPFALRHKPMAVPDHVVLAGHLHPTVRLTGRGRDSMKLPAFILRDQVLILPAFSEFVDGANLPMTAGDRAFGIWDNTVNELPTRS